jgi:hypothetical protein
MKIKFYASRCLLIPIVTLLLLVSVGADNAYAGGCSPDQPAVLLRELRHAFDSKDFLCQRKWDQRNDPVFSNWQAGGGSLNLPAITAAIGLYHFPDAIMTWNVTRRSDPNPTRYQMSYRNWWVWYLASQMGENPLNYLPQGFPPPPVADSSNLKFFKSSEMFSNIYDWSVVTTVIAVRYWAQTRNDTILNDLARRYLRANWAIYAMAAGKGPVWTFALGNQTDANMTPIRRPSATPIAHKWEYNPAAPRKGTGYHINAPFLALAGMRSKLTGHYESDDKITLFGRAIEWQAPTNYEHKDQAAVLDWLKGEWAKLGQAENLYGLTQQDRDDIMTLIQSGTNASSFIPWMGNIRLAVTYRIVGWPGYRASCLEQNLNGNTPSMYGVMYTEDDPNDADPSHALATFLYPWSDRGKARLRGTCVLENGRMRANNYPGDELHPPREVAMPLPTSQPSFHLLLSPGNAPQLDNTSPANWPPPAPKENTTNPPVFIPAGTAFGGDVAWVTDSLPQGAAITSYNEDWYWVTANPSPYTEAAYVHQSYLVPGDAHQHYFTSATETLTINAGDTLYAYVNLDPVNPPSEVMLQWYDPATGWEHRAFWGADNLPWGGLGTTARQYMGPLPQPLGEWARLEVPASQVGLEGHALTGMAFTLYGGRATWDEAGKNILGVQSNLALGRSATQSSTWNGQSAQLAIDDNTGGIVSHTNLDAHAWWQLDLGSSYWLSRINIWNRTDCCAERLSSFYVFVSDQPFASSDLNATLSQPGVLAYYITGSAQYPSAIPIGRSGRYLRIQLTGTNYLSLAEVEVYGDPVPATPPPALSINDVSVTEGSANDTSVYAIFNVSLSAASANTVLANFSTANGTALANSDYTPVSGTLTFSPGQTTKSITVPIFGDTSVESNETFVVNLSNPTNATIADGQGQAIIVNDDSASTPTSGAVVWVEDNLPSGTTPGGENESWSWVGANPPPFSGTYAHQSSLYANIHQHFFTGATGVNALTPRAGDKLFAYVYLDPMNPPSEVMLQWADSSSWNHRAYWGANQIGFGTDGMPSRRYMGPLPPAGRWVRLEVPASVVGVEGVALQGMSFTLYGGRATWDYAGKVSNETVWVEDALPWGAVPVQDPESWYWVGGMNPSPFSGNAAHQSSLLTGRHQHYFYGASDALTVNTGDKLFTYVYLDPLNPPSEIMLQWDEGAGSWAHRAYWGANLISDGVNGTASRQYMGALPAAGRWVRLEVPASAVGLEGRTVNGMAFTLYHGRATWDYAGKSSGTMTGAFLSSPGINMAGVEEARRQVKETVAKQSISLSPRAVLITDLNSEPVAVPFVKTYPIVWMPRQEFDWIGRWFPPPNEHNGFYRRAMMRRAEQNP